MLEIWKDIKGFENYKISNFGKVVNNKTLHIKKPNIFSGYLRVRLCNGKKIKNFFIHRLVAIHFIENKKKKRIVNHIDGNKLNNIVSNLEWNTIKENGFHGFMLYQDKYILQLNKENNKIIKKWNSMLEIERKLKIHHSGLSRVLNGKLKTTGGFKWEYEKLL